MRRLLRTRFALPALAVAVLALVGVLAALSGPGAPGATRPVPNRAPVTTASRICPQPPGNGTRIALFSAPSAPTTPAGRPAGPHGGPSAAPSAGAQARQNPSAAQLMALGSSVPPLLQAGQPGRLWLDPGGNVGGNGTQAGTAAQAPVAVEASAAMARGLQVEETSRPQGGAGALTGIRCPAPGTDFWFAAPGQAAAGSISLYLINPGSQPASADVDVYTDSGPLQGAADSGLTVPPGGRLVQAIDKLTPGSQSLALHVRTTAGQVVAAVQAGGGSGSWLPPAGQPNTTQVIPGNPGGGSRPTLYLADPGGSDAEISVQAVTSSGTYEPTGGGGIDVPSGTAVSVGLPAMNGIAAALRVHANVPVTASVMSADGNSAYTAATAPITEQAVAADNSAGGGYATTLVLSAPAQAAHVALATGTTAGMAGGPGRSPGGSGKPPGGSGNPAGQVVAIPARHTTAVNVPGPPGGGDFAIVVTPLAGSGPVYAARVLSGPGGAQSVMPMASAPSWVPLPEAAGSLTAVLP